MKCPNCSREIDENAAFCGYCGSTITRLPEVDTSAKDEPVKPKNHKKIGLKIWFVFAIISVVFGGILGLLTAKGIINLEKYIPTNRFVWTDFSEGIIENGDNSNSADLPTPSEPLVGTSNPFEQDYWVIYTEGNQENRIEAATIDSSLGPDLLYIIWDSSLYLNDESESDRCTHYYLDDKGNWSKIGSCSRFTDNATEVIASNLDIYDKQGNLIRPKCSYLDINWEHIKSYQ